MICRVKKDLCHSATDCFKKHSCPYLEFRSCSEVLAENERLKVENDDLRRVFEVATKTFKEKETEIQSLKREMDTLQRKLRDLLQRPFARNIDIEEECDPAQAESADQCSGNEEKPERKKRGAPKGHRGATRKKPDRKPDRTVFVAPGQCPKCHSHNVSSCAEKEEHTQEDIVIIRPAVTRFVKQRGYCRDCGATFWAVGLGSGVGQWGHVSTIDKE